MASTLYVTGEERAVTAPPSLTATDLLLLLMALIWGVNYAVVKYGTVEFAPLAFNSARIVLAAVVLASIVSFGRHAWPRGRDRFVLLGLGALGNGVYQIFFVGPSPDRVGNSGPFHSSGSMHVRTLRRRHMRRCSCRTSSETNPCHRLLPQSSISASMSTRTP